MSSIVSAKNLKSIRKSKGWNQLELAKFAGVDKSVISRLERELQEDVKASILVAIAAALETSVDSLLVDRPIINNSTLVGELELLLPKLGELSFTNQRHLAAILKGF